ncbi:hypothetical protein D4A92_09635 [Rhizobium rosettiformans]|uniref:Uncharacterized protein n=1 Tax=Rhizobium rosettiformans TaxID=1368430 RepID=A0ABX7EUJ7_9HYPH|nr:hypothetical protein [Rhizobium rosettiformans]QRF51679.1 hypothetical protein D4A92_09635 [Rhizobium rosettiformans]
MRDASRTAVLAFYLAVRRDLIPGGQTRPASVTTQASAKSGAQPMAKADGEIASRNPFMPSPSPACQVADLIMIFSIVASALAASLVLLLAQF